MQPFCVSFAVSAGVVQCAAGRPSLIQTKAYRSVPLLLTTTVSAFTGVLCERWQSGFEDISIVGLAGGIPVNRTRPEMAPAVAGSTWASGKEGVAVCGWGLDPQALSSRQTAAANTTTGLKGSL